jgi:hypothetical protein
MDFAMQKLLISSSDLEYLRALSRAWFDGLDSGILLEKERLNNVPRLQPEEIEQQHLSQSAELKRELRESL